jgi:deazaflavin-dependent oxidoreductase (nitroreductase family)
MNARLKDLAGESFCYLTTIGRRTGRPHEIEIWFGLDENHLYMLSGGGYRSDWVRNLRVNPDVRIRIAGNTMTGRAGVASEPLDAARKMLAAKYQGWHAGTPLSGWARSALLIIVEIKLD